MSSIIQLVLFILTIIAIIYLYRRAEAEESNLFIKLFGYSFLGAFMLDLNGLKLPLGFLVFLLFFQNIPSNAVVKKRAAYVGLAIFITSLIVPFIETKIYELPQKVQLQETNFFNGSLVEEWKNIMEELEITNGYGLKMRDFQTVISADGEFNMLQMSLVEEAHPYVIFYHINLSKDGKSVEVKRSKTEANHWGGSYYSEVPDIHSLLYNIDLITKPMLNDDEINYYTIRTDGQRTGYAIVDQEKFSISERGKEKIENSQLPADGILVFICGSSKIDQYSSMYTCEFNEHFLLGMMER